MTTEMESCCTARPAGSSSPAHCPQCHRPGRLVERITVKAMLRPSALIRLSAPEHRFCSTPHCPVIYFGIEEVFNRENVIVPVFQKDPAGNRTVCYCFAITEADLRGQIAQTGRSTAAAEIKEHVEAGRCACELKNPQGSCCLGNVARATREAMEDVATESALAPGLTQRVIG